MMAVKMDIQGTLENKDILLTEAAVIEALKRSRDVTLHPRLENALLIYDEAGRSALINLYRGFIAVAHEADVPAIICTPTWRANHERLVEARITNDVNVDAVKFLKQIKKMWADWAVNIFIGGQLGCKNDCYKPGEALSKEDAVKFHFWQVDRLANAGVDFLLAATIPAVSEAVGIAVAMAKTNIPYIISFVINKDGNILDGSSLEQAFNEIEAACRRPPLGYMINCAYPSFLNAHKQPASVLARLIGFQANASSLDHEQLDGAVTLQADKISDWGDRMIALNKKFGVKILGGCCGTRCEHLRYIVHNLSRKTDTALNTATGLSG